ncbi:MAG: hypothetical protein A2173_06120 [Planctomycetes bacterium RBG_13_44_8b]|nr:MAG: hypothetical protein A2173_06120 [Planctomycetes bacterium RBG_13_44_8b]
MEEKQLEKALNELAKVTAEPVRPGLSEDIKQQIPHNLNPHRRGMDTINIIIDLRINKLAAAAIIIATMILLANLFGWRDSYGNSIYQDSKILVAYLLRGKAEKSTLSTVKARYEYLLEKGEKAVFYGDKANFTNDNEVLLQWKLPDGNYTIITSDLKEKTVSPEELIELLSRMLQDK